MPFHRAISSVLLMGKLLARAHCWAPPAFRNPGAAVLSTTTTTATSSSSHYKPSLTTLAQSSLSVDVPATASDNTCHDDKNKNPTTTSTNNSTIILADDDAFLKPERDPRQYRMIRLANQLQVLLVSDRLAVGGVGAEAGAVHVQAGHFDDTVPGLAHFHEHLLFLGE